MALVASVSFTGGKQAFTVLVLVSSTHYPVHETSVFSVTVQTAIVSSRNDSGFNNVASTIQLSKYLHSANVNRHANSANYERRKLIVPQFQTKLRATTDY